MYLFLLFLISFYLRNINGNHQFHSCVGYCNTNLFVENSCFCNDDCLHKNNCCFNFLMVCSDDSSNNTIMNNTTNNLYNHNNQTLNHVSQEKPYYLRKNTSNNIYEKSLFEKILYLHVFLFIIILNLYMYLKTRNQ
jgi:hypothetical protein